MQALVLIGVYKGFIVFIGGLGLRGLGKEVQALVLIGVYKGL